MNCVAVLLAARKISSKPYSKSGGRQMHNLTWGDAVYFLLFFLTAFIAWRVAVMLATGKMRLYGGVSAVKHATRAANPKRYWMNLAVYAAILALLVWMFGGVWLELARKMT